MRGGFLMKLAAAAALVVLADRLFLFHEPGWTLGLFALAWTLAVALCLPATRRHPAARGCLLLAGGLAAVLVDDPNPLAALLFPVALSSAALLPGGAFRDAGGWLLGGIVHGLTGIVRPVRDLGRLARLRERRGSGGIGAAVRLLALPLAGGGLFLALFAAANPLVAAAFDGLRLPFPGEVIGHVIFAALILALVWPSLRPGGWRPAVTIADRAPPVALPVGTIALSLLVFNALFAVENALDLVFLWSGASLPSGVTLADYAHRGAYTLIVTALLAAAFVLVALHPRSDAASSRTVRRLLVLWMAQNLLLVASSARRLAGYVAAYSLTELRIAAFAWMALVAVGLLLVCRRLVAGRSARWLINANALAAGLVLVAASAVDLGAMAATYNVRHAGQGAKLDLCYLARLGPSALLPVIELERRARGPLKAQVAGIRALKVAQIAAEQADWHAWTWRNARRLAAARAVLGTGSPAVPARVPGCDAMID